MKKITFGNSSICVCEINRYLTSIVDDLVIISNEIIDAVAKLYKDTWETVLISFLENKRNIKSKMYIFHLSCH